MNSVEENVLEVFQEVLKLDEKADTSSLKYNESKGWDSIGHMSLIAGLEEKFDCMLETEEILDMSSLEKAVEIMEKYG